MKSVFVTGAAQGIGLAIARAFAAEGCRVGLFDLNEDKCRSLLYEPEFEHAVAGYCDVRDSISVMRALSEFAAESGGRLDVLVNNAGVLTAGDFVDQTPEQIQAMLDVNIKGLTMTAHAAFPWLRDTPNSAVVNLCSASSIHGIPLLAVYSASKFYVDGFTQALNLEWEEHDIFVTSVKPPVINTAMGHQLDPRHLKSLTISMEADEVALAVVDLVKQRRLHRVLGRTTRVWYWLDRILSSKQRRAFTARLLSSD